MQNQVVPADAIEQFVARRHGEAGFLPWPATFFLSLRTARGGMMRVDEVEVKADRRMPP
jgi:hypothetical protein